MAVNLLRAGHQVEGFDIASAAIEKLKAAGGSGAASLRVVASRSDVVITMLPAGPEVRECYSTPVAFWRAPIPEPCQ